MLQAIYPLENPIQPYAWGSRSAIPKILGLPSPSDEPAAELWMGTHPKAPSRVITPGGALSLTELIRGQPEACLGRDTLRDFGPDLPYLFKILAADAPLSIQAHPDGAQAAEGFDRETQAGIPLDAPERNYRDPNPKPECICALTPFWAMRGFRRVDDIGDLFMQYCPDAGQPLMNCLKSVSPAEGLREFFKQLMSLTEDVQKQLIAEVLSHIEKPGVSDSVSRWVDRLSEAYPGDIGVLSPLFLNTLRLEPGEAMYLPAGELHAYLEGVGVELMGNSDNVLRGGLTPKHVDVDELVRVLTFASGPPAVLTAQQVSATEWTYLTPADAFSLSIICIRHGTPHATEAKRSAEILLVLEGRATLHTQGPDSELTIGRGQSVFIPAATQSYSIEGESRIYKASVPLERSRTPY